MASRSKRPTVASFAGAPRASRRVARAPASVETTRTLSVVARSELVSVSLLEKVLDKEGAEQVAEYVNSHAADFRTLFLDGGEYYAVCEIINLALENPGDPVKGVRRLRESILDKREDSIWNLPIMDAHAKEQQRKLDLQKKEMQGEVMPFNCKRCKGDTFWVAVQGWARGDEAVGRLYTCTKCRTRA